MAVRRLEPSVGEVTWLMARTSKRLIELMHAWSRVDPELCSPEPGRIAGFLVGKRRVYVNLASQRQSVQTINSGLILATLCDALADRGWPWSLNGDVGSDGEWSYDATVWVGQEGHAALGPKQVEVVLEAFLRARGAL